MNKAPLFLLVVACGSQSPTPEPMSPAPEAREVPPPSRQEPVVREHVDIQEMGLSEMSLKEAYAFCDKKEDLAKDCAYQIWQADLMALRPGSENTQAALSAAEEVYSRHAPFALERNPRFRTRFWTWFWGSWWKEQPRQKIGGIEQCDSFDSAKARRRCIQWSEVAWDWLIGRTGGLPEID